LTTGKPFPKTAWDEFVHNETGISGQKLALAMLKAMRVSSDPLDERSTTTEFPKGALVVPTCQTRNVLLRALETSSSCISQDRSISVFCGR
jgi:hypothetical protein